MMMTPEENMDDNKVFIPISEETLPELSLIDSYTVSNMAKELIMLRAEVRRLRVIEAAARAWMEAYLGGTDGHTQFWAKWCLFMSALAAKETP